MRQSYLFFTILFLVICSCKSDGSQELRTKAYDLFQKKDYQNSLPLFEQILKLDPDNLDYRLRYGNSLEELGKFDDAISQYKIILEKKDSHLLAIISLANAYRKLKEIDLAVLTMKRAISLKQGEPWILDNYGNILEEAGENQLALEQYQLAVKYEPNDPEYRTDLANICLKMQKDICFVKDNKVNISTLDIYRDLQEEAQWQYQMLKDQEANAEQEEDKKRFSIQKEVYLKKYNFASDMVKNLSKKGG